MQHEHSQALTVKIVSMADNWQKARRRVRPPGYGRMQAVAAGKVCICVKHQASLMLNATCKCDAYHHNLNT